MRRLRSDLPHPRKLYKAVIWQLYAYKLSYHIELRSVTQHYPYVVVTDVNTVILPVSRYQEITDLDLKIGDRIQFMARYSNDLWGNESVSELRPRFKAPAHLTKLPPLATIDNLVRAEPFDVSYDFYYH